MMNARNAGNTSVSTSYPWSETGYSPKVASAVTGVSAPPISKGTRKRCLGNVELLGRRQELLNSQACLGDQRSQSPAGDLRVIRNRECHGRARLREHDMTTSLPRDLPTQALERANNFARSKQRESRH